MKDIFITSWRQMGEPIIFLRTFAPQFKIGGTVVQERITHHTEHSVRTQTWATPQ